MKSCLFAIILFLMFPAVLSSADHGEAAATAEAQQWLALIDRADYAQSWQATSPLFKTHVTREQFTQSMQAIRTPLGKTVSRTVKSATYTTTLPGVPDGHYVVVQFETSFEHKASAIETVTPSKGDDGQWHVSGYYIR